MLGVDLNSAPPNRTVSSMDYVSPSSAAGSLIGGPGFGGAGAPLTGMKMEFKQEQDGIDSDYDAVLTGGASGSGASGGGSGGGGGGKGSSSVSIKHELKSEHGATELKPQISSAAGESNSARGNRAQAPPTKINNEYKFSAIELQTNLIPVWKKLHDLEPEAIPFRVPVDADLLQIPVRFWRLTEFLIF